MVDLPPELDSNGDSRHNTPRWVYVFGVIAIILVLLFGILLITGHGPGRHTR